MILSILLVSITRSFGDESKQIQSNEDTEDEPIYSNHKYFDEESMGSIQKCNLFKITKIIQFIFRKNII